MRNKYRLVTVDPKGEVVFQSDFPRRWGAERIFERAPLKRGHTMRLYRRRRHGKADRLLAERGRGPRIGEQ